jgi:hypothetical protein
VTKDEIKQWLLNYAWVGDDADANEKVVDCIMSQDDWKHTDVWIDRYSDAQFGDEEPEVVKKRATEFALSSLYECHDAPHLETCPYWRRTSL